MCVKYMLHAVNLVQLGVKNALSRTLDDSSLLMTLCGKVELPGLRGKTRDVRV